MSANIVWSDAYNGKVSYVVVMLKSVILVPFASVTFMREVML